LRLSSVQGNSVHFLTVNLSLEKKGKKV
jgi:hypothetical protein